MEREEFERVVARVLDGLPGDFAEKLDNVEVEVADVPSGSDMESAGIDEGGVLLGLYHGVPLTHRGMGYFLVLPDKISIYQRPIERVAAGTGVPVEELVRKVVLHEIAHHFGIPDERLEELGY